MTKRSVPPSTFLAPVPAALVSCQVAGGRPNIITLAWTGVVCSDPPMIGISIRPSRYSYGIIRDSGEFALNIPPAELVEQVDLCGILSGRDVDKFAETGLTPLPALKISPPLIAQCGVNMECRVTEHVPLGTHDLFLAEILATHVDEEAFGEDGNLMMERINPLGYIPPDRSYRAMGDALGSYGYSRRTRD